MAKNKTPGTLKKQPTGDYPNGYGRPPAAGRIKPGEVRNPHGRNGKPKPELDAFERAVSQPSRITIGGKTTIGTIEDAAYLSLVTRAANGDASAMRLLSKESLARRGKAPPPPTAEEQAVTAEDMARRQELSAKLIRWINSLASLKKQGLIEFDDTGVRQEPWIIEAISGHRERLGLARVPGRNERWNPQSPPPADTPEPTTKT